ncbi:MAG: sigma-54-dependent Fis family transcriptional regulator, partial [Fibrobacteres bacterium]|nr:sigma-54-dependent Fis family transcriptional regulator [Fibrobacterota bacterium]
SFFEIGPDIITPNIGGILLTNRKDSTIVGFDDRFLGRFKSMGFDRNKLLGLKLENIISPTPAEFQKANIDPYDSVKWNMEPINLDQLIPSHKDYSTYSNGSWHLSNNSVPQVYLSIPGEFSTYTHDIALEITAEFSAALPYFTLGGLYQSEDNLPDEHGYFIGFDPSGENAIIKKAGITVFSNAVEKIQQDSIYKIGFAFIGRTFHFTLNGKTILSYFDKECNLFAAGIISVGVRRNTLLKLHSAEIKRHRVRGASRNQGSVKHIITVSGELKERFVLENYYAHNLNTMTKFIDIDRYILYDITDLQSAIEKLGEEVKVVSEKGRRLEGILKQVMHGDNKLIGKSAALNQIRATALTAADTNATVLIEGETGTGKEVLARFIHDSSRRKEKPFIKIDCSTIPSTLIESHLFGHEKGAFTGAVSRAKGMFEAADNGTIFLDEAGNLPLSTQAKLLQFFNDFTITRLGGNEGIKINVRCIVASNLNLDTLVKEGRFREDLYYRLSVIRIRLPGLRERKDDIPELATHFLENFSELHSKRIHGFSTRALKMLIEHNFPGNIRELKNVIENAVVFSTDNTIQAESIILDSPIREERKRRNRTPFKLALTDESAIRELLARHFGSVDRAAKELGVGKANLYSYLKERGIDQNSFRKGFSI